MALDEAHGPPTPSLSQADQRLAVLSLVLLPYSGVSLILAKDDMDKRAWFFRKSNCDEPLSIRQN